jgi:hypothetical protein
MLARLTTAVQSGKWAAGLNRVTVDQWKAATINKGIPRIANGIDAAADKVVAFASQLLPFEQTLQGTVSKMPNLNLEDSINRMTAWTRGMAKFTRK